MLWHIGYNLFKARTEEAVINNFPFLKIHHCIVFRLPRFEKAISQCQLTKQILNFWIIPTLILTYSTFFQTHVAVSRVMEVTEATERECPSQTRRGFYKVVSILMPLLNMITFLLVYDVDPTQLSLWWMKKDVFSMSWLVWWAVLHNSYCRFNARIATPFWNIHRVSICSGQPKNLELDQDDFTQIFTATTLHRLINSGGPVKMS